MLKRIIQVSFDKELLAGVGRHLKRVEKDRMDRAYQQGYEKQPEKPDILKARARLLDKVLEEENW